MIADYSNTNTWYGWLHYYIAHLMTACGCKTLDAALTELLRSCARVGMVHAKQASSDILSDNECILYTNPDWLTHCLYFKPNEAALEWWKNRRYG